MVRPGQWVQALIKEKHSRGVLRLSSEMLDAAYASASFRSVNLQQLPDLDDAFIHERGVFSSFHIQPHDRLGI